MTANAAPSLAPLKAAVFLLCLLPAAHLLWAAGSTSPGFDAVAFVQRRTGIWTFNLLLATLCISPLRSLTGLHWLLRLRRMLGLFTFFYATLHFLAFIGFDHAFAVDAIARDIFKRPFVIVGFAAFALLLPLAATSNAWAVRRLGGRRWQELHRGIYLIAILAALHYFWLTKATELMWPLAYAIILALLLRWRIQERRRKASPVATRSFTSAKPIRFFPRRPD